MAPDTVTGRSGLRDLLMLVLFAGGCLAAGSAVGSMTGPAIEGWYDTLVLPSFQPPNIAFPIAWTIVYVLMATAAWLVWRRYGLAGAHAAFWLFGIQLVLNLSWTPVFFGARSIGGGLVLIVIILVAVLATTIAFWRKAPVAGVLFLPYFGWVGFATFLNFTIWRLNP